MARNKFARRMPNSSSTDIASDVKGLLPARDVSFTSTKGCHNMALQEYTLADHHSKDRL